MKFEDFFDHEESSVADAAHILAEAKQAYDAGDLTYDEFQELSQDVLEIGQIEKLADTLERKIAIQKAVDLIKLVVNAIPKP